MRKICLLIAFVLVTVLFMNHRVGLKKENIILANIEVLAAPEDGVKIRSCYMDKDVTEDLSAASKYTICNSQTTSGVMYKCGNDKQGNFKDPYSTPTAYKCMY